MTFCELLRAAKKGDKKATDLLIKMYMPLIRHYSYYNGVFDEDLHQEQLLRFLSCIRIFSEKFPR